MKDTNYNGLYSNSYIEEGWNLSNFMSYFSGIFKAEGHVGFYPSYTNNKHNTGNRGSNGYL